MTELYLGVDAGNSKTLAAVADRSGRILGWARGGLGDIYGAPSPDDAVEEVFDTVRRALAHAGAKAADVRSAAFRLAGVDWPEDSLLWARALESLLDASTSRSVKNDGFALLRCGDPSGTGVAVSIGTGAAIGARGGSGDEFVVSWWFQHDLGAAGLGSDAIRRVMLAELGLGEPTALTRTLLEHFGLASTEELLRAFTRRADPLGRHDKGRAARAILATAAGGDAVARTIVADHATRIADYIAVSAGRVRLTSPTVVLGGSVLAAPHSELRSRIVAELALSSPRATIVETRAIPILGAVLDALAEGGVVLDAALHGAVLSAPVPEGLLTT